ncbi:MAG: hypothetical protein JWM74_2842 [Myxococcaceae bacterium]|nr:hypothetical protein [Myxococcaceae bacterium]
MRRALVISFVTAAASAACAGSACTKPPGQEATPPQAATHVTPTTSPRDLDAAFDAQALLDASRDGGGETSYANVSDDPYAIHHDTKEELLAMIELRPMTDKEKANIRPDLFLNLNVGQNYTRMNQGNKAVAKHSIGQRTCLEGLKGIVLQTEEQKAQCKGMPNMVPIYRKGDKGSATYCIDQFEFPNKPCELPFVWAAPAFAQTMCKLQGKRLCSDKEWNTACSADPAGGPDTKFAYGDTMDLTICNTNKARPDPPTCNGLAVKSAWETCGTDTEPAGAYPKCRSRFNVFDHHGNVAEIMTRKEEDGTVYTQLKGSAFFYVDVSRQPGEPQKPDSKQTYPDHCNFDPRWHVEPMATAGYHVNYHLGFRCCMGIAPTNASSSAPDAGKAPAPATSSAAP